jgi:acyl carrier protein
MTRESVHDEIMDIISKQMNMPIQSTVDASLPLGESGIELDSIKIIELVARIETKFTISIPDSELMKVGQYTVGELIDSILNYIGER